MKKIKLLIILSTIILLSTAMLNTQQNNTTTVEAYYYNNTECINREGAYIATDIKQLRFENDYKNLKIKKGIYKFSVSHKAAKATEEQPNYISAKKYAFTLKPAISSTKNDSLSTISISKGSSTLYFLLIKVTEQSN